MKHTLKILFIPLLVIVLAGCQFSLNPFASTATTPETVSTPTLSPLTNASDSALQLQNRMITIYHQVNPGVVSVFVDNGTSGGLGSGFVYDTLGHIITNAHVVQDMTTIEVDFPSGLKAPATLVGIDLDSDIAVIKVDVPASDLVPLVLGDSSKVQVGQIAIAIGSPLFNYNSMTQGIVSAIGRVMDSLHPTASGGFFTTGDMIQTDAAINLGNSGGPLLDINGEVIGINRAIQTVNNGPTTSATAEPGNIGIGFAIPVNIAKRVVPFLIKDGSYSYPYLGITSLENIGLADLKLLGLQPFSGLYITSVAAGGPAEKAGIKAGTVATQNPGLQAGGDVVTAIDGITITSYSQFITYLIENKSPGDNVVLTVLRDNKTMEITVTLGSRPK